MCDLPFLDLLVSFDSSGESEEEAVSCAAGLNNWLRLDEWEQNTLAFAKQARDKGTRRHVIFDLGSIKTPTVTGVTKKNNKL
jgi:hypothetical protein